MVNRSPVNFLRDKPSQFSAARAEGVHWTPPVLSNASPRTSPANPEHSAGTEGGSTEAGAGKGSVDDPASIRADSHADSGGTDPCTDSCEGRDILNIYNA